MRQATISPNPQRFLWCTTEGNLRVEGWLREQGLSYKRFWASMVNWCNAALERSRAPSGSISNAERAAASVLCAWPTNADTLMGLMTTYANEVYSRGDSSRGLINLDALDDRAILYAQEALYNLVFTESERATQRTFREMLSGRPQPSAPSRADRTATRREKKLHRRAERREEATAAAHALVSLARPGILGPLSSLDEALPSVSAAPAADSGAGAGAGTAGQMGMQHGDLALRGVEEEGEDE